jgi:hypothetical protein
MQKQDVDQSLKSRLNQRQSGKAGLGLLGVTLLLSLALGSALMAFNVLAPLAPEPPNRAEGVTARLVWYFQEGRMKADVRTLAAVFRYLVEPEPDTPRATMTNFANLPVAEELSSPKS